MKNLIMVLIVLFYSTFAFGEVETRLPDITPNELFEAMYKIDEFILVENEDDVDGFHVVHIRDKSFAKLGYCFITTEKIIYVGGELSDAPEEWSVILHEIGHLYDPNGVNPEDHSIGKEIRADEWAVAHGAKPKDLINVLIKYGGNDKFKSVARIFNLMEMEAKESPVEIRRVKLE